MGELGSSKVFANVASAELEALRSVTRELTFAAGDTIFLEGDPGDGAYVIKEGLVQITSPIGVDRRVLTRLSPGEIFGELAILDDEPRSASASAEKDSVLYFIPRADFLALVERNPRLLASISREISRRLREFNNRYVREVLQSERLTLVGRFARSIVHDLKNPLNVIGISAEMATMDSASREMRHTGRQRIARQIERISSMVNELLEFTRGSQTSFVHAPSDYGDFVRQVVEEIQPELDLKAITVELENAAPSVKLRLNPPRLTQVFHNLIHNASEAMPDGGKIILRFQVTAKEVITELEDTGPGIPEEIADRIFEPFATMGKVNGTGLGLSICKKIIQDHGGEVWARHEPRRGAIIAFQLPISADAEED